jgi:hypothetical protein
MNDNVNTINRLVEKVFGMRLFITCQNKYAGTIPINEISQGIRKPITEPIARNTIIIILGFIIILFSSWITYAKALTRQRPTSRLVSPPV